MPVFSDIFFTRQMDSFNADLCPFPEQFTKNALRFTFRKHTKIERILKRIDAELRGGVRQLLFYAIGDGCERCISCVEVLKQRLTTQGQHLFQWNVLNSITSSSKLNGMDALKIAENFEQSSHNPLENYEKRQPSLSILVSFDPFPSSDGDSQHTLSQQRNDQEQHLPSFTDEHVDNIGHQKQNIQQKKTKKIAVGMAKRTKPGNNKWKKPVKGAPK